MKIHNLPLLGILTTTVGLPCVGAVRGPVSTSPAPGTSETSRPAATAAESTVSTVASPAPAQSGVGVPSARNLTLAQGDLTSPAEFTLPLPKIFTMRPSEFWPSEAFAEDLCDGVSLKSVRVWKRKDKAKSALYEVEFDIHVPENDEKFVEILFSVMKGTASLGTRKILAADCDDFETTTMRGEIELPTAELEAMFAGGSRPALVIILRVQSHLTRAVRPRTGS